MKFKLNRRQILSLAAGGTALAATGAVERADAQIATKARIVIIGAGAGGTALANRLVSRLNGADITLIDPRAEHLYQPGLSLVAAGLKPANYVVSKTTDWLPDGINEQECVALASELQALGADYVCVTSGGLILTAPIKIGPVSTETGNRFPTRDAPLSTSHS